MASEVSTAAAVPVVPPAVLVPDADKQDTDAAAPLEGEALRAAIRKQVEYYFSKQNLSNDAYLVSQMTHDNYVPISTITKFKLLATLTTDSALIADVMRDSKEVEIDAAGQHIRPVFKIHQRVTVILRDLSPNATVEQVKQLFKDTSGIPAPKDVRQDIGNTCYLTFENEEDTIKACDFVRTCTLDGKKIQARIKSENILRSYYPIDDAAGGAAGAASAPGTPLSASGVPLTPTGFQPFYPQPGSFVPAAGYPGYPAGGYPYGTFDPATGGFYLPPGGVVPAAAGAASAGNSPAATSSATSGKSKGRGGRNKNRGGNSNGNGNGPSAGASTPTAAAAATSGAAVPVAVAGAPVLANGAIAPVLVPAAGSNPAAGMRVMPGIPFATPGVGLMPQPVLNGAPGANGSASAASNASGGGSSKGRRRNHPTINPATGAYSKAPASARTPRSQQAVRADAGKGRRNSLGSAPAVVPNWSSFPPLPTQGSAGGDDKKSGKVMSWKPSEIMDIIKASGAPEAPVFESEVPVALAKPETTLETERPASASAKSPVPRRKTAADVLKSAIKRDSTSSASERGQALPAAATPTSSPPVAKAKAPLNDASVAAGNSRATAGNGVAASAAATAAASSSAAPAPAVAAPAADKPVDENRAPTFAEILAGKSGAAAPSGAPAWGAKPSAAAATSE